MGQKTGATSTFHLGWNMVIISHVVSKHQKPWPKPKPGPARLGFGPWLGFHILKAQAKESPAKPEALG